MIRLRLESKRVAGTPVGVLGFEPDIASSGIAGRCRVFHQ
jgi:hypothetical protein